MMKGQNRFFLGILLLLALSCGPKKAKGPAAVPTRDFPVPEVPMMITDVSERMAWIGQHYWDLFTRPDSLYYCDSLTINGVPKKNLEQQMGIFATLVNQLPLPDGIRSMGLFYDRLEAFQRAQPSGNLFSETVTLTSFYFYDPNSPLRNEDLYLPFVSRLAESAFVSEDFRPGYRWDARMCALNRTGTPAADFVFIDTAGKRRSLYSIRAERTLLIFGNPDCEACRDLQEEMESYPEISAQIADGSLQVVDIYIDEDIEVWKARIAAYPPQWINGYDPGFTIRQDLIYNVRAVPSLYLLDAKKTVLLKDATPERVLDALL